jgi:hypothetical protein
VALRTIDAAGSQEAFLAPSFAADELDADGPAGEALRAEVSRALQVKNPEFHSLGLVLGYDYADSPVVVPDGTPRAEHQVTTYEPTAVPGARLPHVWLPDGSSIYDLLGDGFAVLRLGLDASTTPLSEAATVLGIPLRVVDLVHLPRLRTLYAADLVLLRPDQHVAWRGTDADDPDALLRHVVGTTEPNVAAPAPTPLEEIAR